MCTLAMCRLFSSIFIRHYFRKPRIDLLPEALQASVFDMYVNAGGKPTFDKLQHPDHEQVVARRDVHAHETHTAAVLGWQARARILARRDQIVIQPGTGRVEPFQLIFLRPGILVGHPGAQRVNVTRAALRHRFIDIDMMAGPDVILASHQLVKLVALAIGRRDHPQLLIALRDHGEKRRPDCPAIGVKGELVQHHIG
ncbi:MAG: hypothetical protein CSA68_04690 [Rhodobacterales bacterium]|nr:MAG: hypothetical protein CSA68_04690 [Rhodobacterales bacterium]